MLGAGDTEHLPAHFTLYSGVREGGGSPLQPQQTLCPSAQLLRGAEAGSLPAQSRALALSLDTSHTRGHPARWFLRSEVTPSAYGSGKKPHGVT